MPNLTILCDWISKNKIFIFLRSPFIFLKLSIFRSSFIFINPIQNLCWCVFTILPLLHSLPSSPPDPSETNLGFWFFIYIYQTPAWPKNLLSFSLSDQIFSPTSHFRKTLDPRSISVTIEFSFHNFEYRWLNFQGFGGGDRFKKGWVCFWFDYLCLTWRFLIGRWTCWVPGCSSGGPAGRTGFTIRRKRVGPIRTWTGRASSSVEPRVTSRPAIPIPFAKSRWRAVNRRTGPGLTNRPSRRRAIWNGSWSRSRPPFQLSIPPRFVEFDWT